MSDVTYKWFDEEMVWKRNDNDTWLVENPPLPRWAQQSTFLPPVLFIEIWNGSAALNDVKRELFWLTHEEIQQQKETLSQFLSNKGYAPLQELLPRSEALLTDAQLEMLMSKGVIQRADQENPEETEKQEEEKQETASGQPQEPQEEHDYLEQYRHIQISEGGGLRFRARH